MKNKRFQMIMYALGYVGISILTQTTVKWYQYFYMPPDTNNSGLSALVPIGFIGLAMVIARVFDGIADPVVAYFSDNLKSRRGRRIPFILLGSVPLTLSFIALWFPPVRGQSLTNFIYLTFVLSLFFIFFTIVAGPYLALITEISRTKKERINLTMLQGVTQIVGVMAAELGSGMLINSYDFRVMGIVLGIISLFTILLTPIFVREESISDKEIPSVGITTSLKLTLSNKNFVYYLLFYNAIWFGINTLTIALPYITEVLLQRGAEESGFMIAGAFVLALIFTPLIPRLTLRFGGKRVLQMSSVLFSILLILTGLFGKFIPYLGAFVVVVLAGIPLAVLFVIPNAMLADIAELDGIERGQRREGMFFGVQGLVIKIVIGLSSFIIPLLFKSFGYSIENPLGLQLCGPIAGLTALGAVLFLNKYSITPDMLEEARG